MASGSVPITAGSGTAIATDTNAGLASGANVQIMALANADGTRLPNDPDGTLQVSPEPAGLFIDDFSGTLSTNWTTGGTAPSSASGVLTTSNSTTASASSYMRSIGAFTLRSGSYLLNPYLIKLETTALANNSRWWGIGTNQGTPTAAAPVLNGAVFLLDYNAGALYAATYSAGTRGAFIALTRPSDGNYHRYEIRYRQSIIYWVIDGVSVASYAQPNLAVAATLPIIIGSANFTTAPSAAPSLSVTSAGVSDLSATHRTIGDGVNPWQQATVKAASTAAAATDLPLVVALHPSSTTPNMGTLATVTTVTTVSNIAQVTGASSTGYFLQTTASTNATAVRAAACSLFELTVSNTTATAAFLKIYNKASAPTVGTDVPVLTLRLAATGSAGDTINLPFGTNGKRLSAGLAIAVTAAAAYTDTAATVAGIQISLTYV